MLAPHRIRHREASYDEVQLDRAHETIDDLEKVLAREIEHVKSEVRDKYRASLAGTGKSGAVGALVGGGLGLAPKLWSNCLEGKNAFRGELTAEDWKETGVSALKGAAACAVSGFSVYVLTVASTGLGAPFAGSLVSALMGVGTLLGYGLARPWQAGGLTPYAGLSLAEAANRTWRTGLSGTSLRRSRLGSRRAVPPEQKATLETR